jgi:hypothetical protein
MTNESNDHSTELRRIVRMLEKTASMAEHASLTGSMGGGKDVAVRSYNSVLEHLAKLGEIPAGLFSPLPTDANLDSAGIASAQLAEYLREGLPEPEQQGAPGQLASKLGDHNVLFNIGSLGEIADLVRDNLPEWLRGKRSQPEAEPSSAERREASESASSATPPPAAARGNGDPPPVQRLSLPEQQVRIEELRPGRQEQTPR